MRRHVEEHAIEDNVGDLALEHERDLLVASIARDDRDAIRVDAYARVGLERIVEHDHVERFRLELLPRVRDAIVRLEREAHANGARTHVPRTLAKNVWSWRELDGRRGGSLLDLCARGSRRAK